MTIYREAVEPLYQDDTQKHTAIMHQQALLHRAYCEAETYRQQGRLSEAKRTLAFVKNITDDLHILMVTP